MMKYAEGHYFYYYYSLYIYFFTLIILNSSTQVLLLLYKCRYSYIYTDYLECPRQQIPMNIVNLYNTIIHKIIDLISSLSKEY